LRCSCRKTSIIIGLIPCELFKCTTGLASRLCERSNRHPSRRHDHGGSQMAGPNPGGVWPPVQVSFGTSRTQGGRFAGTGFRCIADVQDPRQLPPHRALLPHVFRLFGCPVRCRAESTTVSERRWRGLLWLTRLDIIWFIHVPQTAMLGWQSFLSESVPIFGATGLV
jgi:hypothetical protein